MNRKGLTELRRRVSLLKKQTLEIRIFHVRKGPNIGPEPNFHDRTTSKVKDYPEQPKMGQFLTLRYMAHFENMSFSS